MPNLAGYNFAFSPDGNTITVTGADGNGFSYINSSTITPPAPAITEVDVVQGANTIKFVPAAN